MTISINVVVINILGKIVASLRKVDWGRPPL